MSTEQQPPAQLVDSRLRELLAERRQLHAIICRDPTLVELELLAAAGCDVVWLDLEHGFFSAAEAGRWCRVARSLGLVPLVRIAEITRAQVQSALDAGCEILVAPNVTSGAEARRLAELAKYPPLGSRGLSSTAARTGYRIPGDVVETMAAVNGSTHVMVQIESDEGWANLDEMLADDRVDMVTVGPADWSAALGAPTGSGRRELEARMDDVLRRAAAGGRVTAMVARDTQEAERYRALGVAIMVVGVDIALRRNAFAEVIGRFTEKG